MGTAPPRALSEVFQLDPGSDPRRVREENFVYGLDLVLDGVQARLAALSAGGAAGAGAGHGAGALTDR